MLRQLVGGVKESVKHIIEANPDILAITFPSVGLASAVQMAFMIKQEKPLITIIVGGSHFSALPEKTLQENTCFDIGIIGEGERTLERLLFALKFGDDLFSIEGLAFRENNRIVMTAPGTRIEELDELPMPAFDLLPEIARYYRPAAQSIKYLPAVSLVTSRGCPGRCLFCDRKVFGNKIRMHGAEYVADMMEKLHKDFGVRGIHFEDDNFMLSEERLTQLASIIKKRNIRMAWSALSRVDSINERIIKIAKSCGCWQVLFGIESGSQKILDFYKKGITLQQISEAVALARKHAVLTKGFLIIGNPLETLMTLQETKRFVMGLPLDDISVTYFTPYPGSEIWDQVGQYGKFNLDWEQLTCFDPVFVPRGMSRKEICDFQTEIYKSFYGRPSVVMAYVSRLRSLSQVVELYKGCRALRTHLKRDPLAVAQ